MRRNCEKDAGELLQEFVNKENEEKGVQKCIRF